MARAPKGAAQIEKTNEALGTLTVEYVSVDAIKPNSYNPNRQNEHEFRLLVKSIEEDGFTQPVIVGKDDVIVDGEHRWRAAKTLGMLNLPIVRVPMEGAQARIATLRHNRARGTEDLELSVEVLRDLERLGALDWAADSLDLSDSELERLLADIPAPEALAGEEFGEAWVPGSTAADAAPPGDADATPAAADALRAREKRVAEAKTAEERAAAAHDKSVYSVYLQFAEGEAEVVKAALEPAPARRLLELCMEWAARQPPARIDRAVSDPGEA